MKRSKLGKGEGGYSKERKQHMQKPGKLNCSGNYQGLNMAGHKGAGEKSRGSLVKAHKLWFEFWFTSHWLCVFGQVIYLSVSTLWDVGKINHCIRST